MRALLLSCVLVVACSKKQSEPPPPPAPDFSSGVPEAVLDRFGESNTVFAVDLGALFKGADVSKAREAPVFKGLPCGADVLLSSGVVVVSLGDTVEGYVSRMPEEASKQCIRVLEPYFHWKAEGSGAKYQVVGEKERYSLVWLGSTMHLTEVGTPAKGKLSPVLRALIRRVPKDAVFWVASLTMMGQAPNTVAWAELMPPNVRVTVNAGGTPEQNKAMFDMISSAMKSYAEKKHQLWDDSWITTSGDTLVLVLPLEVMMMGSRNQ